MARNTDTFEGTVRCVVCGTVLPQLEPEIETLNANALFEDGLVDTISAGYGSRHDGDVYVIAICDACVTKKKEDGSLIYLRNYLLPEEV